MPLYAARLSIMPSFTVLALLLPWNDLIQMAIMAYHHSAPLDALSQEPHEQILMVQDHGRLYGALYALRILARKYEFKDEEDRAPLTGIVNSTFPALLQLFQVPAATEFPLPYTLQSALICRYPLPAYRLLLTPGASRTRLCKTTGPPKQPSAPDLYWEGSSVRCLR